jgi:Domain of unknown function (DUF5664)
MLEQALRNPCDFRYDILDTLFLEFMAKIASYGAIKYGEFNYQKSRLSRGNSPINHIYGHLKEYRDGNPYDHLEVGIDSKIHLAAIAFNAMMEFYYCSEEFLKREEEMKSAQNIVNYEQGSSYNSLMQKAGRAATTQQHGGIRNAEDPVDKRRE